MLTKNKIVASFFLTSFFCSSVVCQTVSPAIRYLSYAEAEPVIRASRDEAPLELATTDRTKEGAAWEAWVRKADREIRGRLEQGDEDSIVNLLLFGTSFTRQPRMTEGQMNQLAAEKSQNAVLVYETVLQHRLDDFSHALAIRRNNERLSFAKNYLIKKLKISVESEDGKIAVKQYLIQSIRRVLNESTGFAKLIEQARNNKEDEFVVRSMLFSRRGLSSDTSLKPNLAIENAIAQLKEKGRLKKVLRVAIIGPGLDFTDKDEGYDLYPPQTLQPFAVIESLLKLSLADKNNLQIDTFDLSPKVNSHISGLALKAKRKEIYAIQLPLNTERKWTPEFIKYWGNFGGLIALPAKPMTTTPALPNLYLRTVDIRSEFLGKVHSFDTNIVLQSPALVEKDRYDLIIGTNIFVYYGSFEQGLAMLNLEKMLKDGGMLLSNNALVEFPFTPIHTVGYSKTIYSEQKNDGDVIVWYQKKK